MERRTAVQGGTTALLRSIKAIAVSGPEKRAVRKVRRDPRRRAVRLPAGGSVKPAAPADSMGLPQGPGAEGPPEARRATPPREPKAAREGGREGEGRVRAGHPPGRPPDGGRGGRGRLGRRPRRRRNGRRARPRGGGRVRGRGPRRTRRG